MMVKVGIDAIALYTAGYKLDLATLALARGILPEKFEVGLGQQAMSVPPPGEDIVTMAANAAQQVLTACDVNDIEMLLFATESGVDQSKAAGLYIHELLGLNPRCRVVELKQACYGATMGLQLAIPFIQQNPNKKVLLIASDIARYGLNTSGESSQGCGAAAMIIAANPRIIAFEAEYGVVTESVMDFWRPNYRDEALVDGKYSSKLYLTMLEKSWKQYQQQSSRQLKDHDFFCYHAPVPRLVEKAHQHLMKINAEFSSEEEIAAQIQAALHYNRQMGNSYTASLYVGLVSLLDSLKDLTHKRIGFYSYGSGCVAEYFSGIVQSDYHKMLHRDYHQQLLARRKTLTYQEYESLYQFKYVEDGSEQIIPQYETGNFRLAHLQQHKRIYQKKVTHQHIASKKAQATNELLDQKIIKVRAPGKLILSGEHAVVYGKPALAMAVDKYVNATVSHDEASQVLFDLTDLAHRSRLSFDALRHLKNKIKGKYLNFIRGDFSIREVLQKPFELAQFALSIFAESLHHPIPPGVKFAVQSDLPIGCGMGSSAATILSVIYAAAHYLQLPISSEKLYELALEAENMQHGHSSGLDLRIAIQGGCIYQAAKDVKIATTSTRIEERPIPTFAMSLVNTGTPLSTTGQCIEHVANYFKSASLAEEFAAVTDAMDEALKAHSRINMYAAVKENHRLLTQIGVVPLRVQHFIADVEAAGGVAKTCGAGAVSGQNAGAVLVMLEDQKLLQPICHRYGYNEIPIAATTRGVHAA